MASFVLSIKIFACLTIPNRLTHLQQNYMKIHVNIPSVRLYSRWNNENITADTNLKYGSGLVGGDQTGGLRKLVVVNHFGTTIQWVTTTHHTTLHTRDKFTKRLREFRPPYLRTNNVSKRGFVVQTKMLVSSCLARDTVRWSRPNEPATIVCVSLVHAYGVRTESYTIRTPSPRCA